MESSKAFLTNMNKKALPPPGIAEEKNVPKSGLYERANSCKTLS